MTDDALYLLTALEARGLSLRLASDGQLIVSPSDRITVGDRAEITEHRDALAWLVAARKEWADLELVRLRSL